MHLIYRHTIGLLIIGISILSGCRPQDEYSADMILVNGKIITVDSEFSIYEGVAIKDGRIQAVGSNEKMYELSGSNTTILDLKGNCVIPGIIEGHLHPIQASRSELYQEVPDVRTLQQLLHWISMEARKKQDGEWIIHPKFFATRLEEMRAPTLHELDSVAPHNPVFLDGSYGGTINSSALFYSDIKSPFDHPGILKNDQTGQPNGLIRRSAFELLKINRQEDLGDSIKIEALKNMLEHYNQVGITSICSGLGTKRTMDLFRRLKDRGNLTVRIYQNIIVPFSPDASREDMYAALKKLGITTGDGDEWIKTGALKTLIDGGILTGTAFLREPWGEASKQIFGITDNNYRGILNLSKKELVNMISVAAELEWKFTAHVTGGGGVDTLLAAYREVHNDIPIHDRRFSIIHGNFFNPASIQTLKELGVYVDMQPAWFYKDADLLIRILGEQRMRDFHPYRSLFESGIIVNGGSDHMVKLDSYTSINPYNPFLAMWATISRKTERGTQIIPSEAISREQALRMYTINNAFASFEEDLKGSIEPGKFADLAVLSFDYLTCPTEQIKDMKVLMTIVDGQIVYRSEDLNEE
jgi:predicted amidohydrolase YtcJ